jgi:hypothetical protein
MCKAPTTDANAVLEDQVQRLVKKSKGTKETDPILKLASKPQLYGSLARAGTPIYVGRFRFPVFILSSLAAGIIVWSIRDTNLAAFGLCVACSLVGYDLLSGFLHIVFDNPANLHIPILGQPCLEFQMHHHFPTDLVQRKFLDVLGDLNFATSVIAIFNYLLLDFIENPVVRYMGGLKLFMAYYGQFSHRSAHSPNSEKNPVISLLRKCGFMIPLENHRSHHRPPHDMDFCLVGCCNPVINFMYHKITRNRWFWMIGFFSIGLGGIAAESFMMEKLLRSIGLVSF